MLSTNDIRKMFLEYFKSKGHKEVKSSSLIPENDNTIMFVNAGMVQFKDVFLGLEKRAYTQATSSQKCLRISGKHNDFEAVGRTPRHHTFFEMLGNFSFGEYFKSEAIAYGWDFLTNEVGFKKEDLLISVYEKDQESFDIWSQEQGVPKERIYKLGEKENFWSMGNVGPCGPCTEIHFDRGEEYSCGPDCALGVCDCDRYLEIWNLVFMEFNRLENGQLEKLPKPSVDTGMGLERISSLLQGKDNNYEIDIFMNIIKEIERLSGIKYNSDIESLEGFPFRVISDHLRAASFLICDGILPSNEGKGYVLRRILRRAIRLGKKLNFNEPTMYKLVHVLVQEMGDTYEELVANKDIIEKVIKTEEEKFMETLNEGLQKVEVLKNKLVQEGLKVLSGKEAFHLYDTFGFPVQLTKDYLDEFGLSVDEAGFNEAMKEQKELSKKGKKRGSFNDEVGLSHAIMNMGQVTFVGYEQLENMATVIGLMNEDLEEIKEAKPGDKEYILVSDTTSFYGESGGQVGDTGSIYKDDSVVCEVLDTKKTKEGSIYHIVKVEKDIVLGDKLLFKVDGKRRRSIERNHSVTHLLHKAIHEVIGKHGTQKGSFVAPNYFRFDFNHFQGVTPEEIREIEDLVNSYIFEDLEVKTELMSVEEGRSKGAMAIFGEKYGEKVRVVTMGETSMELCGGTHLRRTSEIGIFKITQESSVGSGIRRIEGITGESVVPYLRNKEDVLKSITQVLNEKEDTLVGRIQKLYEENKEKDKEIRELNKAMKISNASDMELHSEIINEIKVVFQGFNDKSGSDLKELVDIIRNKEESVVVLLGSEFEGKVPIVCGATDDLVKKGVDCGKIVKTIANFLGGSGGGRKDFAQAGAKVGAQLNEGLLLVKDLIREV